MNISENIVAAFDFDGTITTKDTLFDFIKFCLGTPKFLIGLVILSPTLVMFKLKLIKNDKAKQKMFSHYFKGMDLVLFNQYCESYKNRIDQILNEPAIAKLKWHQQQGHEVIIISASVENWIIPWAKSLNIATVLSTKIAIDNQTITGVFSSPNCHGAEKVNRLKQFKNLTQEVVLYAYGDSSGDKELLELANFPFYRKFN